MTAKNNHPELIKKLAEGITNDPSWQETLPRTSDTIALVTVLPLPPRGDRRAPRRDRYVNGKAIMDPTPRSTDAEMGSGRITRLRRSLSARPYDGVLPPQPPWQYPGTNTSSIPWRN